MASGCIIQIKQMEKSMVQELNVLTYSTVFSSRPSFISTHISDPEVHQLRRSRIQNLPGYRKEDLSAKINFVVVFQTIQIQRLSQEIETLRVKAKDWDRQRLNYQNYQVQIRELTERCYTYELQREGMQSEAQKMKIFCQRLFRQFEQYKLKYGQNQPGLKEKYNLQKQRGQQLQAEIDKWRNRCTSMQRSKMKELEDIRLQLQAKRKSSINREIREVTINYENQLHNLGSELRKAREESEWRAAETHRLQQLINGFTLRENQVKEIQDKIYEYQNRLVMLSQENYRLNQLLRWKVQELDRLKISQKELRARLAASQSWEEEAKGLRVEIGSKNKELEEMRAFSSRSKAEIQQLRLQQQKLREYQALADKSSVQIQKLNSIIHNKINQLDQIKNALRVSETKLNAINNASQKQFATYQEKLISYSKQLERLGAQLKNRISENQNYKLKCSGLQRHIERLQASEDENKELKIQLSGSMKRIEQFKNKIHLLEESVTLMHEIQLRIQNEQQVKQDLLAQRQKLNERIRSLTLQLETAAQKMAALQYQAEKHNNLRADLKQYQAKIAFMTTELDRINSELHTRIGELHQLRQNMKTINNSKNIFQSIEKKLVENLKQMESLVLDLDNSRRENDRLHNDNMNLELAFKRLQGELIGANHQKEQATRLLKDRTTEIQKLNSQVQSMAARVAENRQLSQQNQQFMKKNEMLKNNYEQLDSKYRNETKRSQSFSMEIQKLSAQLIECRQEPKTSAKLTQQITFLKKGYEEKSLTISNMTKRIEVMQNLLKAVKQRYSMQVQISQQLHKRVDSAYQQMAIFDQLIQIVHRYSQELSKVNEQNLMLESSKRLLDLELCQSMKVVEESEKVIPPTQLWTTFGKPCSSIYQNESVANKIPIAQQDVQMANQTLYTFKDVQANRVAQSKPQERQAYDIVEQQTERDSAEMNSIHDARETTSMASSFINTLVTKQSVGRFEKAGVGQFISANNPNFANISISKMRYVSNQPSPSRSSAYYLSPSNAREHQVRYVAIDSQMDQASQSYTNPFQIQQPHIQPHYVQAVKLENAGVKRVTSETHFVSYPGMRVPLMQQVVVNQPVVQDVPNIRVLQAAQSLNIANSTKSTSAGKSTIDTARLYPSYRM